MKTTIRFATLAFTILFFSCSKEELVEPISKSTIEQEFLSGLNFDSNRLEPIEHSAMDQNLKVKQFNNLEDAQLFLNNRLPRGKSYSGNILDGTIVENDEVVKFDISKLSLAARDRGENDGQLACGHGRVVVSSRNWHGTNLDVHIAWSDTGDFEFNSELSGITIGQSYEHSGASFVEVDGTVYYRVIGYVSWNLEIIGYGEYYRERIEINGAYNTCNGDYTINYY